MQIFKITIRELSLPTHQQKTKPRFSFSQSRDTVKGKFVAVPRQKSIFDERPMQHLRAAGKLYPNAWKLVDKFRDDRGNGFLLWPRWCFLPMAAWYAIVCDGNSIDRINDPNLSGDIGRLAAIGAWRYTQGIYRFDPEVYNAIRDTNLTGNIPAEVLYRLPEWCVYIKTPGLSWATYQLHGFWVHLEWDANTERHELRFLMDTEESLIPFPLHLGPWPLEEAVSRSLNEAALQAKTHGMGAMLRDADSDRLMAEQFHPLISLVLYLCSDSPDISATDRKSPTRPEPKRTKKGWRLFPPDKPTVWRVGEETGAEIREAKERASLGASGRSPRTHLRRAHWHGYWTGTGEQKRFRYNWLSPIIVRGQEDDELSETQP